LGPEGREFESLHSDHRQTAEDVQQIPKKQNGCGIDLSNGPIARATAWRIEAPPECLLFTHRQSCESYAQNLPHPQFSDLTQAPPDAANGTKSLKSRSFIER
jgi:hypothetical protein